MKGPLGPDERVALTLVTLDEGVVDWVVCGKDGDSGADIECRRTLR